MLGELLLILLFGVATRSLFLNLPTSDYAAHLWFVKRYQRGQPFNSLEVENGLFQGRTGNSLFPYWLYARLPERWSVPVGIACNQLYDVVTAYVLYGCLWAWLPASQVQGLPFSVPCFGALLYVTTPLLHPMSARLISIGSRTLGTLLSSVYFICLGAFLHGSMGLYPGLVVLFTLAACIVFSSKFALQTLVFVSLALALVLWDYRPALLAGAFLGVLALVPGLNIRVFYWTRLSHARWYLKAIGHETMRLQLTTVYRGDWGTIQSLPRIIRENPKHGLWVLLAHVPPIVVAYSLPGLLWWVVLALEGNGAGPAFPAYGYAVNMTMACLLVTAVTSVRPFIIFGEAERYMEVALPFLVLLLLGATPESGLANLWILLLVNLFFVMFNRSFMAREEIAARFKLKSDKDFVALLEFVRQLPDGRRIITAPAKTAKAMDVEMEGDYAYYFHLHSSDEGMSKSFKYFYNDFLFNLDFATAREDLGANTFILDKGWIGRYKAAGLMDRLEGMEPAFENQRYRVYLF